MFENYGTSFRKTYTVTVVFDRMDDEKEIWLKENSTLVDCINFENGVAVDSPYKDVVGERNILQLDC